MEQDKQIHQVSPNEPLGNGWTIPVSEWEPKTYKEKRYAVRCGCGNLYIIIEYNSDGTFHKVRLPRNTKFNCSIVMRDALAKDATFKVRREPQQFIKDHKGSKAHACKNYSITCEAYSCADAVARVIQREISK